MFNLAEMDFGEIAIANEFTDGIVILDVQEYHELS